MKQWMSAFLLLFMSVAVYSQDYSDKDLTTEFGVSFNAMNCNTDLGGLGVDVKGFKMGGGAYMAVLYRQFLGLRIEANVGAVTASDARATKVGLQFRNLDFTSSISELSLLAEIHPLNISQISSPMLSPYLLAGAGYFSFNPKTQLNGNWVYLQPLHTEGQGFPETGRPNYKLSGINIPVGGGLQYNLSERLVLRGEIIYRFLDTDYLDDVSTTYIDPNFFDKYLSSEKAVLAKKLADRGYEIPEVGVRPPGSARGSQKNDAYYSLNLKLGVRLGRSAGYDNSKPGRKLSGCYAF